MIQPEYEIIGGLVLGICLSAACGFRLFIPPLVLSVAGLFFHMPLPDQMHWLASEPAFFTLLVATLFEVGAYYVPWLDNMLDSIATPAAVVAGTLLTSGFLGELDPVWQWSVALIAGGGIAGSVQSLTNVTRLSSSLVTAGIANPIVTTMENLASVGISLIAVVLPIVSIIAVMGLLLMAGAGFFLWRKFRKN